MSPIKPTSKKGFRYGLGLIIVSIALFFLSLYFILAYNKHYSLTVESYQRDNETVTDAFEQEKRLRRTIQREFVRESVELEHIKYEVQIKDSILSKREESIKEITRKYNKALKEKNKIAHERDSVISRLNLLERVY